MRVNRVLVTSPRGKMGSVVSRFINEHSQLELCGVIDKKTDTSDYLFSTYYEVEEAIKVTKPDVCLIFSPTDIAFNQAIKCLERKVVPIIGTTGFTDEQILTLKETSELKQVKLMIIPNFAIGAVLMMKYAKHASKYLKHYEIIEMHHPNKKDAPSGTAKKIAELIEQEKQTNDKIQTNFINNLKRMNYNNDRIHSIRLEGIIANHQVIFGSNGETLTLKHDTISRESFCRGIELAIFKLSDVDLFTYGLEQLLD